MVGETANRLLRSADTVSARASILVYCPLPAATATGVPSCEGSCAASRRRALRRLLGRVCALAVLLSAYYLGNWTSLQTLQCCAAYAGAHVLMPSATLLRDGPYITVNGILYFFSPDCTYLGS